MSEQPYQHIYLSPHYDDASLSCGAAIYQQSQAGQRVLVITICAAPPSAGVPLSPFAQSLHQAWGNFEQMVALRQSEDQAALAILGCDDRRLAFTDCIYRGDPASLTWYYTSDADIFGEIHPADLLLAGEISQAISAALAGNRAATIYAPLTVGHHVDHQLVQASAWDLFKQGWPVLFYEDYPYADPNYPFTRSPGSHDTGYNLAATLAAKVAAGLRPELHFFPETALQAKIDSIAAYASQLQVLFGGPGAMAKAVRAYAQQVGQGRFAERLWRPQNNKGAR
jgi:LmbE family N-acetylglucosaminyl deacetylase